MDMTPSPRPCLGPSAPLVPLALALLLPACAVLSPNPAGAPGVAAPPEATAPLVSAPPPPPTARTVEEFDTTTAAERAAAKAPAPTGDRKLGLTVVSLGDPTAPGFWLETPLVKTVTPGRVVLPATGASVQVELRPIDGPASGGSRISLAAMRLLGVALTALPEVEVHAGG